MIDLRDRLFSKTRRAENGCLEWVGALYLNGYGAFRKDVTAMTGAHRAMWELCRGPIPDGLNVCHTCDNRKCVDIDHLFLATQKENLQDMTDKGRRRGGKPLGLTPNVLAYARLLLARRNQSFVASMLGVHRVTLNKALNGRGAYA